jgi:hypothetical protein
MDDLTMDDRPPILRQSVLEKAVKRLATLTLGLAVIGAATAGSDSKARPLEHAAPGWYYVNLEQQGQPDCIPLTEDPMSSLARTFGRAPMRVLQRAESVIGRQLVVEVDAADGPSRFAFTTTQTACSRLKAAVKAVDADVESQHRPRTKMSEGGFTMPSVDLEAIKRRDPSAFCDKESCATTLNDLLSFNSERICLDETLVSFSGSRSTGASCRISASAASQIRTFLGANAGAPSRSSTSLFRMKSDQATWTTGRHRVGLVHWTGLNAHGATLDKWNVLVTDVTRRAQQGQRDKLHSVR